MPEEHNIVWFEDLARGDVARVGGKNASLGEMVRSLGPKGIEVPPGFATTAEAFRKYLDANGLTDQIYSTLAKLDDDRLSLRETGRTIREWIIAGSLPGELRDQIVEAYRELGRRVGTADPPVAVRSSATAEDLPDASFAGQQESFLNVRGEAALIEMCKRCYASLFTDRAITYRQIKGFAHEGVALSVGIQLMVRADTGGAGVMFSIDTETGFRNVVVINAAWGLGENVVQGKVDPDEYHVFKPLLGTAGKEPILEKRIGTKESKLIYADGQAQSTKNVPTTETERQQAVLEDNEILSLARQAGVIEEHYGTPMDIEWGRDGGTGRLYILQARPETVQATASEAAIRSWRLREHGRELLRGLSIGEGAVSGPVCLIEKAEDIERFIDGSVLVTTSTDPDWVPVMKRAAAIVTDHGGRTSHAAIVSRELGLPAIVGTGNATGMLRDGQYITVSCAEGDVGLVYEGKARIEMEETKLEDIPATRTNVMVNLANPASAYRWWRLPTDGVGLARMEFVISNEIRIHPLALTRFEELSDQDARREIAELTRGYADREAYFVERLARSLSRLAAVFHPKPILVRMSDFKTNEYANLLGGAQFEIDEENPMIGFRGASRYCSDRYRDGFMLECRAIRFLRQQMGFENVAVMVPFCRTLGEADAVLDAMAGAGLQRGESRLSVFMMCEIPSNVILASDFARRFDGFSIGSNDLTQLTLGVDRDSEELAGIFDERDPAVRWMIETVIDKAHRAAVTVGFCGQAPSNDPAYARLLVEAGIDSISVTPDSFFKVKKHVASAENEVSALQGG